MRLTSVLTATALSLSSLGLPVPAAADALHGHRHQRAPRIHRHWSKHWAASSAAAHKPTRQHANSTITGTTYYVSPSGSNTNSGTSPSRAWQTVRRVNRASLNPGDGVLFQGGATFADDTLMPGWGTGVSGTSGSPVVFGSYGHGKASLTKGTWTKGESHIVFENFKLGPEQGITGTGDRITVQNCSIANMMGSDEFGILATGSHWIIRDNAIDRTGDSGMLLQGASFLVKDNTITNTGLDPAITWGDHGIYLKASDSTVAGNTISNFHNDGISVRYRNSFLTRNTITHGQYGIAWFQYDPRAGTSRWTDNAVARTSIVAFYISRHDIAGYTSESFVITGNKISKRSRGTGWVPMDLQPTTGTYKVRGNPLL